jgi:hypothetical protein
MKQRENKKFEEGLIASPPPEAGRGGNYSTGGDESENFLDFTKY